MAYESEHKTSAELLHEVELQRSRVENTIDNIQDKLSPGQLVDELLAYTKGGGGEFVASLQRNVTANPLPVALLGVSLAWLMAKPGTAETKSTEAGAIRTDRHWDDSINHRRGFSDGGSRRDDYPVAVIEGTSLQRLGNSSDADGNSFSEFADDAGKKFKALSDASGKRAGDFVDEAGNRFKGFSNAAGDRISKFRDESGGILDEASGWASHTWQLAQDAVKDASDALGNQVDSGKSKAADASNAIRGQMDNLNQTILHQFRDQPLVGGALAFALGAALGSSLPHTPQEDALKGASADAVKDQLGETAGDLYEKGKEKAEDLYAAASDKAGDLYQQVKDGASDSLDAASSDGREENNN